MCTDNGEGGTRWCSSLRHYATSRKVAGSISLEITGFFNLPNPSSRTVALGLIQHLAGCFWGLLLSIYLVCEAIGTAATPGLLCQPRVIVKMIVEKQMKCRLAGETEVLGGNLPQRHFCPPQNST
jgi:hypothetical protein